MTLTKRSAACPCIPSGAFLGRLERLTWLGSPVSDFSRVLTAAKELSHLTIYPGVSNVAAFSEAVLDMPSLRELHLQFLSYKVYSANAMRQLQLRIPRVEVCCKVVSFQPEAPHMYDSEDCDEDDSEDDDDE